MGSVLQVFRLVTFCLCGLWCKFRMRCMCRVNDRMSNIYVVISLHAYVFICLINIV